MLNIQHLVGLNCTMQNYLKYSVTIYLNYKQERRNNGYISDSGDLTAESVFPLIQPVSKRTTVFIHKNDIRI